MAPRRRLGWVWICGGLVLAALLAARCTVAVDETEYAVVTSFGKVVAVLGVEPGSAGLHRKMPWQSVIRVDRRLRAFDPPPREMITGDRRNLEVASYVIYQVADPERFVRGAGSLDQAEARLSERVAAALSDAIGRREFSGLATTDPAQAAIEDLNAEVLRTIGPAALAEMGLSVVDLGLRWFNHPLEVRPAIFELIRSERRQVAARLRAEGEASYTTITSQADREREVILARADAEAQRIRGQAEAESMRILNEAHARDPKFYELLRTLESYSSILDAKTTVVLSSTSPLLKLLATGPGEAPAPPASRNAATTTAAAASAGRGPSPAPGAASP